MRAAIYARVSTKGKGQTTDLQVSECGEYCKRQGWETELYEDAASGAPRKRPGLDRLMKAATLKMFDVVVVWKLDRFSRSLTDLVNNLLELNRLGVRFVSITQGIDTDKRNPTSELLIHILAAMSEFEHSLISERVKAGIARRREKGLKCGGGTQWKVIDMQRVKDMREQGYSIREIAEALKQKPSTIFRRLKRTQRST